MLDYTKGGVYMKLTFGEKVKNLREDRDVSQGMLGEKLSMTQRKLSYIENNKYEPSLADIRKICLFFDVSADYLLDLPPYQKK